MHSVTDAGPQIRLRALLPDAVLFGADDIAVGNCTCDSRRVRPGDVFVALLGSVHDGHHFIAEAVARGAAAIVVQNPKCVEAAVAVPHCLTSHTGEAYGRICQALAGNPSQRIKVIAVTGANGKTTTSCLIAAVLSAARRDVGLLSTLGCFDGVELSESKPTTPTADKLAHSLVRMVANGCSHAIMEVSSQALAQGRTAGITFDAACVTNVRRDHLDYHHSMLDYRLTKSKIFEQLAPEGFGVINADDPTAAGYLPQLDGPVLTVGIRSAAEITATLIERCASEQTFLLTAGSDTMPVCTAMIGQHHVYNCLVAAAVGLAYGIDLPTVVRGLEAVRSVPGRLERIECGQPFGVFVDSAHTPDALAAVLSALREVTQGRLICVVGAGGDRDRQDRPLTGREVELGADLAVITNDNSHGEDPQAIAGEILSGFHQPAAVRQILDRPAAIAWALGQARPGDCVLIAGWGNETRQIIGDETIACDDAEIARRWLYEVKGD